MYRLCSQEGLYGLYRGYYAGLIGTVHGGVQFYFLELLKTYFNVDPKNQTDFQMIVIPAISKMIGKG